jgi:hypothetical protein
LKSTPYVLKVTAKSKVKVKEDKVIEEVKEKVVEKVIEEVVDTNIYDGEFTAKIWKVDSNGVAHIVFSEEMIDEKHGFNMTWIDETLLKLSVIPTEGSVYESSKYIDPVTGGPSLDFHNFTWEPKLFRGDTLQLQLDFKYPLNVSTSGQERDVLEL